MKDDDDLEHEGLPDLLIHIVKAGISSFVLMAAVYAVFSDVSPERALILWLSFWVIALMIALYRSLKKNNSIIQKYNQQKSKSADLKKKKKAVVKQFETKSNHIDMIRMDIPLVYNLVRIIAINQDRDARMEGFEYFKEALTKWENQISK